MCVYIAEDRIQVAIPIKWYGRLDCNGYNKGINKHVKRRVFFSPFGDHVEPDFGLPISDFYQPDANACYEVYFLRACDTKEECIEFLNNRRVLYPSIYNERRLHEHIPDPRPYNENLDAENAVDRNAEVFDAVLQNLAVAVERNNNVPANGDDDCVHVDEEMFGQLPETVNAVPQNLVGAVERNNNMPANDDGVHEGAEVFENANIGPAYDNANEEVFYFDFDGDGDIDEEEEETNNGSLLNAVRVKREIKAEVAERLLEANQREPIVDLCSIDDPEEAAGFAAIDVNNEVDDSDDEISVLFDVLPQNNYIPITVKFDFDSNDILSGNIPFEINVCLILDAINFLVLKIYLNILHAGSQWTQLH